jgi:addiction module HigA family antidote
VIESFGNAVAEDIFYDRKSKSTRSFPNELRRTARRKLLYLHDAADLKDLRVPPGNRLEPLKGNLKGFLEPQGMSQAGFARKIGWTKARLNELVRGKRGVTAEAALDLADALGTSPKLWMNLQVTYDLDKAAAARKAA